MKHKTNKSPKLRDFVCIVCREDFQNYLSPSEIKEGKGKVCSKECKGILNGLQKMRGEYRSCTKCSKNFWAKSSEDRRGCIRKYCSSVCYGNKKKTRKMSTDGYWMVHTPNGDMKEQRWVMTKHLGRELLPTEIVHHINFDKLDNRLENLQVVSRAEHNTIHFSLKGENNVSQTKNQ